MTIYGNGSYWKPYKSMFAAHDSISIVLCPQFPYKTLEVGRDSLRSASRISLWATLKLDPNKVRSNEMRLRGSRTWHVGRDCLYRSRKSIAR